LWFGLIIWFENRPRQVQISIIAATTQEVVMEEVHKDHAVGWFSALIGAAARIRRQSVEGSRGFVVTPWSGRSPGGWSA
jgi:hypothetical protein